MYALYLFNLIFRTPIAESETVESWCIAESGSLSAVRQARQASAEELSGGREVEAVQNMALTDCQSSGTDFAEKGRMMLNQQDIGVKGFQQRFARGAAFPDWRVGRRILAVDSLQQKVCGQTEPARPRGCAG